MIYVCDSALILLFCMQAADLVLPCLPHDSHGAVLAACPCLWVPVHVPESKILILPHFPQIIFHYYVYYILMPLILLNPPFILCVDKSSCARVSAVAEMSFTTHSVGSDDPLEPESYLWASASLSGHLCVPEQFYLSCARLTFLERHRSKIHRTLPTHLLRHCTRSRCNGGSLFTQLFSQSVWRRKAHRDIFHVRCLGA